MESKIPSQNDAKRGDKIIKNCSKALSMAENLQSQATIKFDECLKDISKLDTLHTKIDLIITEINKQIQLGKSIFDTFEIRNERKSDEILKMKMKVEYCIQSLHNSIDQLKKKKIDPSFSIEQSILYEFVDESGVNELISKLQEILRELNNNKKTSLNKVAHVSKEFKNIHEKSKTVSFNVDYRISHNNENVNRIHNEINAINSNLISIQSQYDRISHSILNAPGYTTKSRNNLIEKNVTSVNIIDLEPLEKSSLALPNPVSEMADSMQRITNVSNFINERTNKYNVCIDNVVSIFKGLDILGVNLRSTLIDVEKLEIKFEHLQNDFDTLIEEMNSLVAWYSNFNTSYDELTYEIDRRHKELEKQQQLVQSYVKNLQLMWQNEEQTRERFNQFYGVYLPQDLCPSINEPTPMYLIHPQSFTTSLPKLSLEIERPSRSMIEQEFKNIENN